MKILNICFALTVNSTVLFPTDSYEQNYETVYKKIVTFLYTHPRYHFSFSFSGNQLEWIQKVHPEFLDIISELLSRKQIELLGGGYYNPVFPLLFPLDRSGQIERLTAELRRTTGKRPRGMTLCSSIWDNSLVTCLQTCGMEYVQLDSSLIPPAKQWYLPLIVSEQGRSIKVLPVFRTLSPYAGKDTAPDIYLSGLLKQVEKTVRNDKFAGMTEERVVCINFDPVQFEHLFNSGWIEKLYETVETQFKDVIKLTLPLDFIHSGKTYQNAYIPAGMSTDIAQWAQEPYTPIDNKSSYPLTIFDFLQVYRRNHALYDRMLYVSMLINQCHGDKIRKKAARERLWCAQNGEAFVCDPDGIFANNALRQNAYRNLTEAEKLVRESGKFSESVTSFDYNGDGYNEYICRMEQYSACISRISGSICELDIMHNTGNYADNMSRIARFDKVDDNYDRGLFIEHLFCSEEFEDYAKGLPSGNGIFSQVLFSENGFDSIRHEIQIQGKGCFGNLQQPVTLRKKYIANSNGFMVQYILKNESPIALKAFLVVESNFAQTDFSDAACNSYTVEAISAGQRCQPDLAQSEKIMHTVSYLQITDSASDISFVYEPNEDAGLICMPILFRRPNSEKAVPVPAGTTFVSSLCWNVDLAAGREMEKTINFSIVTPKKRRNVKKN
jgi:4-alpha-glucanotransferase